MPFFLFLFCNQKKKERTAKKEKEKHAIVRYAFTAFKRFYFSALPNFSRRLLYFVHAGGIK
jgi:hypothetical protein